MFPLPRPHTHVFLSFASTGAESQSLQKTNKLFESASALAALGVLFNSSGFAFILRN